jgi:crotonobetainyl-CoA:carnitine CoA-transferase CaiB-like acyl-CoA transferase
MFQPLKGLRVIDLTQVLAGPYATYQLALMGAEVIKIEPPGIGDWTRSGGHDAALGKAGMGLSYITQNANKKSVVIDLKKPEGIELVKTLVAKADVFIENYRPGVAERLGLSFDVLKRIKPELVYCSISAYGQDGPLGARPAYDHVIQGMCGIMHSTGTPESGPTKVGAPYVDYATGLNGAFAVVCALHEVRRTGTALHVDVAMLDTSLLLMSSLMTSVLSAGWEPTPSGNAAWSGSPSSGAFATTEGILMVAANNDKQFRALCKALDREDILADERWADPQQRGQNSVALREVLSNIFSTQSAAHWEELLNQGGVCSARVRSLSQVLREEQAQVRGIMAELALPGRDAPVHVPTLGFKVNGETVGPNVAPPTLGGDTEEVLASLGLDARRIQGLREAGVI